MGVLTSTCTGSDLKRSGGERSGDKVVWHYLGNSKLSEEGDCWVKNHEINLPGSGSDSQQSEPTFCVVELINFKNNLANFFAVLSFTSSIVQKVVILHFALFSQTNEVKQK